MQLLFFQNSQITNFIKYSAIDYAFRFSRGLTLMMEKKQNLQTNGWYFSE